MMMKQLIICFLLYLYGVDGSRRWHQPHLNIIKRINVVKAVQKPLVKPIVTPFSRETVSKPLRKSFVAETVSIPPLRKSVVSETISKPLRTGFVQEPLTIPLRKSVVAKTFSKPVRTGFVANSNPISPLRKSYVTETVSKPERKSIVAETNSRPVRKSVVAETNSRSVRKSVVATHIKKHASPTLSSAQHKEKIGAKRNGIFNPYDEAREFGREDYGRRRSDYFRNDNDMMAPFSSFTNPYAANLMSRSMERTVEAPLGYGKNDYPYNSRNSMFKSQIPSDMNEGYMAPPLAPPSDDGFDPQTLAQDYNAYNAKEPTMMGFDRGDPYRRTPQRSSYNERNQFTTLRDIMPKHMPEAMTEQQPESAFIPTQPQQVDNAIDSMMYKLTREQIPERSTMTIPKDTMESPQAENMASNFLSLPPNSYTNGMPDHTVVPTLDSSFGPQGMVQFGPRPLDPRFFQRPSQDMVDGFYNRNSVPSNFMMPNMDKPGLDERSFQSPEAPPTPSALPQPDDNNEMMPSVLETLRRMMIHPPGEGENENENLYRQQNPFVRELPRPQYQPPARRKHHRRRTMPNKENFFQRPTRPQDMTSMNHILTSIDDDEQDFKNSFSLQGTRKNNIIPKNYDYFQPAQQTQQQEQQFLRNYEPVAPLAPNNILNTGDAQQNELESKYRMVLSSVPGADDAVTRDTNAMTRSSMMHGKMSPRGRLSHERMLTNRGLPRNTYGMPGGRSLDVYSPRTSILPTPMMTTESIFPAGSHYGQPERFTYDNFMDPMRGYEMVPERTSEGMYGM